MYRLKLNAKDCVSCGICMDVCLTNAIDMRIHRGKTIEGNYLSYLEFNDKTNKELLPEKMMTFPFMKNSELCNGCMVCVEECPTSAIAIDLHIKAYNSLTH
ncbi:ATP-binding protein [Melioribacter sp. Ez-97]|uniref:ATP-binding protein n=1 Tax=Melioribacter sp. Ez-97 TaxID=3423434 RepID=UPI003ED95D84